jgi:hypothetical protein
LNPNRFRGGGAALVAVAVSLCLAGRAHGAAEVRHLSLTISGNPTSINGKDFNEAVIGRINDQILTPRGLESIESITFGWFFDAEMRYFVRPNFAVAAGVGQLRSVNDREFLPALNAAVQYRAEVLTVPVHLGGAYYLPPYNQGDFQARVYLEGGFVSNVYNRARFQAEETGTDTLTTLGGSYKLSAKGDSPGYYLEGGVHMFFASRFSILIGLLYRSVVIRDMQGLLEVRAPNGEVIQMNPPGEPLDLNLSGIGGRFGVSIGL